jgi:predicted nucleotidyltransferase
MFPRTVALVNSALMLSADTPLPAADIARAAGVAYTPALSALTTLEKRGLVRRSRRAGHEEFEPNTHDVHYPMAYASALVDLPVLEAVRGQRVYAIYAYGSLAQPGGGTRQSDLDLMIVGDIKNRLTVTERLNEIGQRLHRAIDPFYVSPEQFESSKERGDPQVASALAGVRIMGSA